MAVVALPNRVDILSIDLSSIKFTDEQFYQLCISNPELSLELTAAGKLLIMPPVGGESGKRELEIGIDVGTWNRQTDLGEVFSSSTIFKLPSGAQKGPDLAWIERSRWLSLTPEQRQKFPPIAPDFVIELRSLSDTLAELQAKMLEYRDNGVRLGLLIDPQNRRVEAYRFGRDVEIFDNPSQIDCGDVLPGFILDLTRIWQ